MMYLLVPLAVLQLVLSTSCSATSTINITDLTPSMVKGKALLMRHTLAPGSCDPYEFDFSNCSTQRNIDEEGIAQARRIGTQFASLGIGFASIETSIWCRCMDTAQYVWEALEPRLEQDEANGTVPVPEINDALGSVFECILTGAPTPEEGRARGEEIFFPEESTMAALDDYVQAINASGLPELLVTHRANILSLTGIDDIASGDIALYDPETRTTTLVETTE